VGSISFDGVSFRIYVFDHLPPHAHGVYGSTLVVVELGDAENVSIRPGSIQPNNAKRSDVRRIVDMAVEHYDELMRMWEATHGTIER
jgi:hypothetical protein